MKTLQLNFNDRKAYWGSQRLPLTSSEFRLLAMLMQHAGSYCSYRDLYDALRGMKGFHVGDGENGPRTNMRSAIKRLRRKFTRIDPTFNGITNSQAFGYGMDVSMVPVNQCCPTCGRPAIVLPETVLMRGPRDRKIRRLRLGASSEAVIE